MAAFKLFVVRFAIGLGIAAVAVIVLLAILARVVKRPANLGVRAGKLAPCPNSPNCVSTQSEDPRHQIEPIAYTASTAEAKAALGENALARTSAAAPLRLVTASKSVTASNPECIMQLAHRRSLAALP